MNLRDIDKDFFTKEAALPAMNVKEHSKDYEIELSVPGFSKREIEVSIKDDILQICAEKSNEQENIKEDYTRKEFNYDSFDRSIQLRTNADPNAKIKATYKDGVLMLLLAKLKTEKEVPKKAIEVLR